IHLPNFIPGRLTLVGAQKKPQQWRRLPMPWMLIRPRIRRRLTVFSRENRRLKQVYVFFQAGNRIRFYIERAQTLFYISPLFLTYFLPAIDMIARDHWLNFFVLEHTHRLSLIDQGQYCIFDTPNFVRVNTAT